MLIVPQWSTTSALAERLEEFGFELGARVPRPTTGGARRILPRFEERAPALGAADPFL